MKIACALTILFTCGQVIAADGVRKANDRFKDVNVAVKEEYGPIPCTSGSTGGARACTVSIATT
jgi:hypothetical protein